MSSKRLTLPAPVTMAKTNGAPKRDLLGGSGTNRPVIDVAAEIERSRHIAFHYLLRRFRMSGEDAEDAIQDACLSLLKTSKPFEGRSKFTSYFVSIVINAARMQKRATNNPLHRRSLPLEFALGVPGTHDLLLEFKTKEQRKWIMEEINKLPPVFRKTMLTYYLQDKSVGETAEALGISISAVKARLKRGRTQLRTTALTQGNRQFRC
jgi:RNA polymerase sigma factor (sigma-70 family)